MKALCLLFLILLSSCSFYGVIGRNLDYFLSSKVADKLMLNDQQEDEFRKDLIQFLNTEKVLFRDLQQKISELKEQVSLKEIKQSQIQKTTKGLVDSYFAIGDKFIPIISKYLAQLNPDQRKELKEEWDEENKKIEKRIKKSKFSDQRRKFEDIFGDFTKDQKKEFKKYKPLILNRKKLRLKRRLSVQSQLDSMMNGKKENIEEISKLLTSAMRQVFSTEDLAQYSRLIESLLNQTKKEKKQEIIEKLSQVQGILKIAIDYKY